MFRTNGSFKPQTKTINIVLMNGGVGDHVASLVAIDYITKNYPWIKVLAWMPDFLVEFAKHLLSPKVETNGFSQMPGRYQPKRPTKTTEWNGHISPMKISCTDYAFLRLCDEIPGLEHKNYLKIDPSKIDIAKFNLPSKYIVITTGYTAAVREFPAAEINKIAVAAKDLGFNVVFLGQSQTKTGTTHLIKGTFSPEIDFKAGINLIDQTSLLEAARVMGAAQAVLGVDNGLLHVAGCTDVPIIGGFTTVSPKLRMPVRHNELGWNYYPVVPHYTLGCRFCQVKTNFLYGHDYTKCLYSDNLCTTHMTARAFLERLRPLI